MCDETIKLNGSQTPFRLIHYISPEDLHEYHFITNAMHLSAQTIADIYKERWQIELFFKWVKQNLKIKTFLGTSTNAVMTHTNAVMTQVWGALCLYLILALIRFIPKIVHSMRESHDHHFKWWFDVAPVRGKILAPPKRRVSKADYGRPHNEATILLPYFPYMTPVPDPGCIS